MSVAFPGGVADRILMQSSLARAWPCPEGRRRRGNGLDPTSAQDHALGGVLWRAPRRAMDKV
jgi:hypothetical protein